jgi:aerobic-type carbon monoxide dehydrogenase small subunit (CoxS/CutS family)
MCGCQQSVKVSCGSGGCGACAVLVTSQDAASGAPITRSVNSCLTPVFNCLNSEVITAEAIGQEVPGEYAGAQIRQVMQAASQRLLDMPTQVA